jgi:hypothetical protein
MTERYLIRGWLQEGEWGEMRGLMFLTDGQHDSPSIYDIEPLTQKLEDIISGRFVTLRYWACEQEATMEEATADFMAQLMGLVNAKFYAHYSELTGHLWTDDDLFVGGHDLNERLHSLVGKYLIMEIFVHSKEK